MLMWSVGVLEIAALPFVVHGDAAGLMPGHTETVSATFTLEALSIRERPATDYTVGKGNSQVIHQWL